MLWWVWPAALLIAGGLALLASLICAPVGNDVHLFGMDLMGECQNQLRWGVPCASCGMTRSWVWAARGHLTTALSYNVAGVLLYAALVGGGALGALRLATRRAGLLAMPWWSLAVLGIGWMVVFCAAWGFRLTGHYPLP